MQITINKKDDIVMKIIHFFVTEEDYRPVILKGVQNEIWLENFDKDLKLIRINSNYIHNKLQYDNDMFKAEIIRKNISKKTFSFNTKMLNILLDTREDVKVNDKKNIFTLKVEKITDLKKNKLLNELYPEIKEKIDSKKSDINEFIKLTEELNKKTYEDEQKMSKVFKEKKPIFTYSLMAINILIYIFMALISVDKPEINNYITYYFSNSWELIKTSFPLGLYRTITSAFLHADIFHLFFNMYALYVIGTEVEKYYGKLKFGIIYFSSAIIGGLFSAVFMGHGGISIGASGAIFGLFGALTCFAYNYRALIGNFLKGSIVPVLLVNLCLGLMIPGIDIFGHIGGFVGGLMVSSIVGVNGKKNKLNINIVIVLMILLIFMVYALYIK